MTQELKAVWTCNLCKAVIETGATEQPSGWVGYGFTNPGTPLGERATLGHLCATCAKDVTTGLQVETEARR